MQYNRVLRFSAFVLVSTGMFGCGAGPGVTNLNSANSNTNRSNSQSVNTSNTSTSATSSVEAKEPERYQATVTINLEAIGGQQKTSLPALGATVSRNSVDRLMEFVMPA